MKKIKTFLATLCVMLGLSARGMSRLDALSMIESGNDDHAVGRAGEVSRYQILPSVWRECAAVGEWSNPIVARCVAAHIMRIRCRLFCIQFKRMPNDFEYYALWNAPDQIMAGLVSVRVMERCNRFCNLCAR